MLAGDLADVPTCEVTMTFRRLSQLLRLLIEGTLPAGLEHLRLLFICRALERLFELNQCFLWVPEPLEFPDVCEHLIALECMGRDCTLLRAMPAQVCCVCLDFPIGFKMLG